MSNRDPAQVPNLSGVLFWLIWKKPQIPNALFRHCPGHSDVEVMAGLTWLRDQSLIWFNGKVWFTTDAKAAAMRELQADG